MILSLLIPFHLSSRLLQLPKCNDTMQEMPVI